MAKITLTQIQTALLLPVTAAFIEQKLGIAPTERQKRSVFWDDTQYGAINDAIVRFVKSRRDIDINTIPGDRPKPAPKTEAAGGDPFGDDTGASAGGDDPFGDGTEASGGGDDPFGEGGGAAGDDPFAEAGTAGVAA